MQNQLTQFEGLRESFATTIRGALRTATRKNGLDYDTAQAIPVREAMCRQGDYEPEGRWVNSLLKEDEAKGMFVRKIPVQDMTFHKQDGLINGYIEQLDTHYHTVVGALNS